MTQCTWTTPPSREPIEIPHRDGMTMSTGGVLKRAANLAKRSKNEKHLEFGLNMLHGCIEELRRNPTPENVGEFLSLWV